MTRLQEDRSEFDEFHDLVQALTDQIPDPLPVASLIVRLIDAKLSEQAESRGEGRAGKRILPCPSCGCNCDPRQQTGGGHRVDCPAAEAECTCYEVTGGHMPGCAFNVRKPPVSASDEEGARAMRDYANAQNPAATEVDWGELSDYEWLWLVSAFHFAKERGREEALAWSDSDQPIPEDDAIKAAHPLKTGRHDLYQEAMRMVGAKRSKGALVDLVVWLLVRVEQAESDLESANNVDRDIRDQMYDALECDGHSMWADDIIPRAHQVMRLEREAEAELAAAKARIEELEGELLAATARQD